MGPAPSSQPSPIVWDYVNSACRPYDPWLAYGQSKTATVVRLLMLGGTQDADAGFTSAVSLGAIMFAAISPKYVR
ncbi:hypothetical protein [Streptomyces sp. HC307]|uniref:hypothetical protein n=1 Tax=Streptomyces flavusporus TaxID=3385496 RepID=UPI003916EF33